MIQRSNKKKKGYVRVPRSLRSLRMPQPSFSVRSKFDLNKKCGLSLYLVIDVNHLPCNGVESH